MLQVIKKCKSAARVLYRDFSVYRHVASPWMRDISACQREIAELDPHPYYKRTYRRQEIYFWSSIPEWIRNDYVNTSVSSCLDIGCGFGTLALYCKKTLKCDVYTIDTNGTYLNRGLANKYGFNVSINNLELDVFPWDKKFDVIIFTEVLEHLNFNPVLALRKVRSLLAEGGRVYFSTPDASQWGKVTKYYQDWKKMPNPNRDLPIVDAHVYQYTRDELLEMLTAGGFVVKRLAYSPGVVCRHFNLTLI